MILTPLLEVLQCISWNQTETIKIWDVNIVKVQWFYVN
jgi:hypothetical protein